MTFQVGDDGGTHAFSKFHDAPDAGDPRVGKHIQFQTHLGFQVGQVLAGQQAQCRAVGRLRIVKTAIPDTRTQVIFLDAQCVSGQADKCRCGQLTTPTKLTK